MPIDVNQSGQLWVQGASSQIASQKYQQKTAGKGMLQKERSLAAEPTFQSRMQRVIQTGARARGVQGQDPSKYERNIAAKGVQNRIQGIQAAGANGWMSGFAPYAPVIDSVVSGFGPKSDDPLQNTIDRTGRLAVALRQAKEGGAGATGTAVVPQVGSVRPLF